MHVPVLVTHMIDLMAIKVGGTYIDGTAGGGGHCAAILEKAGASARLLAVDRDADAITLGISDTGIGIDAADLPSIFEPFFRGDPARSRDTGGAGLGLAVARTVVSQHGGTITCTSERHRGTTIDMRWPTNAPRPPDQST